MISKFSVFLSLYYNRESIFLQSLDNVFQQTSSLYEVILVEKGSLTEELCQVVIYFANLIRCPKD